MAPTEGLSSFHSASESPVSHISDELGCSYDGQEKNLQASSLLVDTVLDKLDQLLDIVHVPTEDVPNQVTRHNDMCIQVSLTENEKIADEKPVMISAFTQTDQDLEPNTITSLQEKVTNSRWELEVLKDHFRGVEQGFRSELSRRAMDLSKANKDLEHTRQCLARLQERVASHDMRDANRVHPMGYSGSVPPPFHHHGNRITEPDVENGRLPPRNTFCSYPPPVYHGPGRRPPPPPHVRFPYDPVYLSPPPSAQFQCGPDNYVLSKRRPHHSFPEFRPKVETVHKPGDKEIIPVIKDYDHEYATATRHRRVRFGMEEILYI